MGDCRQWCRVFSSLDPVADSPSEGHCSSRWQKTRQHAILCYCTTPEHKWWKHLYEKSWLQQLKKMDPSKITLQLSGNRIKVKVNTHTLTLFWLFSLSKKLGSLFSRASNELFCDTLKNKRKKLRRFKETMISDDCIVFCVYLRNSITSSDCCNWVLDMVDLRESLSGAASQGEASISEKMKR